MRTRVKICGVKSVEDLHMVVEAGVDAVGFVVDVPSSPRSLTPSEARSLVRATPVFVETVAVTVPRSVDHLKKIVDVVNPDAVQVHGVRVDGELREAVASAKLIAAVQATQSSPELALEVSPYCDAILVDTPGELGGTGRTHDWSISRKIRDLVHPKPVILAGGLNAGNVKDAIRAVRPFAVDVSSGVEARPGVKDRVKVFEFVRSVMEAEV